VIELRYFLLPHRPEKFRVNELIKLSRLTRAAAVGTTSIAGIGFAIDVDHADGLSSARSRPDGRGQTHCLF
jgi:hypothetical protein